MLKRIFSFLFSLALSFCCAFSFSACLNPRPSMIDGFKIEDGYLYFGNYPQTIKANSVNIDRSKTVNGYYVGSDKCYYQEVYANPYSSGYCYSNNDYITYGELCYFKVEPIRWKIVSDTGYSMIVVCDSIIDGRVYDTSSNYYSNSDIRHWLNNEFFYKAFNDYQRNLINSSNVDNSANSTGILNNYNACSNTYDKIYLLSYQEAYQMNYSEAASEERVLLLSDYARAVGAQMYSSYSNFGNGAWWLRSPTSNNTYNTLAVRPTGALGYEVECNSMLGVVPALEINISNRN